MNVQDFSIVNILSLAVIGFGVITHLFSQNSAFADFAQNGNLTDEDSTLADSLCEASNKEITDNAISETSSHNDAARELTRWRHLLFLRTRRHLPIIRRFYGDAFIEFLEPENYSYYAERFNEIDSDQEWSDRMINFISIRAAHRLETQIDYFIRNSLVFVTAYFV